MKLNEFIQQLKLSPESIEFQDLISIIDTFYHYSPCDFKNGELINKSGQNEASCKIFAFAQLNQFSKDETLACFGRYYRDDVLKNPESDSHQNIRNFMKTGWDAIEFTSSALSKK